MSEKEKPDFSSLFSDPTMLTALSQLIRGLTGSSNVQSKENLRTIPDGSQEEQMQKQNAPQRQTEQTQEPEQNSGQMQASMQKAAMQQEQEKESEPEAVAEASKSQNGQEPVVQILTTPETETTPFAGLLQNPNLLVSLPRILSAAGPILSALTPENQTVTQSDQSKETAVTTGNFREKSTISPHAALLYALRPYLSTHRQQAIDNIVKMAGLMETFRQLQPPESR